MIDDIATLWYKILILSLLWYFMIHDVKFESSPSLYDLTPDQDDIIAWRHRGATDAVAVDFVDPSTSSYFACCVPSTQSSSAYGMLSSGTSSAKNKIAMILYEVPDWQ